MHTVTELKAFRRKATDAGMSEEDIDGLTAFLSENPDAGDVMEGTGGCRKLRWSIKGNNKGKSGGVRTITLFSGDNLPVFLITAFSKGQKINLSKAERNALKNMADQLVQTYSRRVVPIAVGE